MFSLFGGGTKKEKKEEDRGDNSGSAKAQREAATTASTEKGDEVCLIKCFYPKLFKCCQMTLRQG